MNTETRENEFCRKNNGFIPTTSIILLHVIFSHLLVPFTSRAPWADRTLIEEPLKIEEEKYLPFFSVNWHCCSILQDELFQENLSDQFSIPYNYAIILVHWESSGKSGNKADHPIQGFEWHVTRSQLRFLWHIRKKFPSNPVLKGIFILWIQTMPFFWMCFSFPLKVFILFFFHNNNFLYYRKAFGKEKSSLLVRFALLSYKCLVILSGLYWVHFEVEAEIFKVNNKILNSFSWIGNNQRKLNAIHKWQI